MIYDCFTFFNEVDLLKIRLEELSPVIDKFVIIEGRETHTGKPKKLFFLENKKTFEKYLNKIIYIPVSLKNSPNLKTLPGYVERDYSEKNPDVWSREIYQRNCIMLGLKSANNNDLILISDVDEIPSISSIKKVKKLNLENNKIASFEQKLFYYFFNYITDQKWYGTKAVMFKNMSSPEEIRMSSNDIVVKNGGWHFSFMGGLDKIIYKIDSFGHQELNTPEIKKGKHLKFYIDNSLDIFERPIKLRTLNNINILPITVIKNKHFYIKYFKKQIKYNQNTVNLQNEVLEKIVQNYKMKLDYENEILKLKNIIKKYEDSKLFKIYFFIKHILKS